MRLHRRARVAVAAFATTAVVVTPAAVAAAAPKKSPACTSHMSAARAVCGRKAKPTITIAPNHYQVLRDSL